MSTGLELFSTLSLPDANTLMLFTQERRIRSGEILFHEGDDASAMYIVTSGALRAYRDRSTGETILGSIQKWEMVGEMALFDENAPKKRLASVRALEDTTLLVIADYAIIELGRKHPDIYAAIERVIHERHSKNAAQLANGQL
jgi:CRP-like cAMP-binding protein